MDGEAAAAVDALPAAEHLEGIPRKDAACDGRQTIIVSRLAVEDELLQATVAESRLRCVLVVMEFLRMVHPRELDHRRREAALRH